jgi:hypothetical protein
LQSIISPEEAVVNKNRLHAVLNDMLKFNHLPHKLFVCSSIKEEKIEAEKNPKNQESSFSRYSTTVNMARKIQALVKL